MQIFVSSYLVPKHGGFGNIALYHELITFTIIVSAILTSLAVFGIWTKDRTEFFGLGGQTPKVSFKDYWPVLKGNRALQMLVVAACTDKIALNVAGNATVTVMLFGILMGDYSLAGTIGTIILIPNILITMDKLDEQACVKHLQNILAYIHFFRVTTILGDDLTADHANKSSASVFRKVFRG